MLSPFLSKMRKKKAKIVRKNIDLGHFKDVLIQHLIAIRAVDGEIIDIEFGLPSRGCVALEIYVKEDAEDQVSTKKSVKKQKL